MQGSRAARNRDRVAASDELGETLLEPGGSRSGSNPSALENFGEGLEFLGAETGSEYGNAFYHGVRISTSDRVEQPGLAAEAAWCYGCSTIEETSLSEATYFPADLWLDRPEGADLIRDRVERKRLSSDEAGRLQCFFEKGYLRFRLADPGELIRSFLADVDRFWRSGPSDIAYRFVGEPASMADAAERRERMAPCVLLNLHGHSESALALYLHPDIFRWAELIFDRKAEAFESSFTEFGRSEAPYRDLVYIETDPATHLLTAFVALEDIETKAGPLYVVSGSHRLPLFEFEPGRFRIGEGADYLPARRFVAALADRSGLPEEDLTLRKGEVVIWHSALVHGARRILKPWVTRRGFMVRLTTLGSMSSRKASFWKEVRGRHWKREKRLYWNETARLLERNGCVGFDDPLRGMDPRGLSVWEKIRKNLGLRD